MVFDYPDTPMLTFMTADENHSYMGGYKMLEQCTGARDKNGTLIFEGDVIEFGGERYLVEFADACFWITQKGGYAMELHTILGQGDAAIVGNIHENPELLSQEANDEQRNNIFVERCQLCGVETEYTACSVNNSGEVKCAECGDAMIACDMCTSHYGSCHGYNGRKCPVFVNRARDAFNAKVSK
jgi:hypothetical protein